MYKARIFIIPFILVLMLLSGCGDDDGDVKTMTDLSAVIESGDTYKFVVTTGVEEDAVIVKHPAKEYAISEFRKDSATTNGIYTYQPAPGFSGVDEVEIEKSYYTFDTEPQLNKATIKIRITVEKAFPEKVLTGPVKE